jgi:hypothetical protein
MRVFDPGAITIDGSDLNDNPNNKNAAETFEDDVYHLLDKVIKANQVGLLLLNAINADKHIIRIVPYFGEAGVCNAYADSDIPEDSYPKGDHLFVKDPNESERDKLLGKVQLIRSKDRIGTGDGSNVHIKFSPDRYDGKLCGGPSETADAVLFHEMIHGLRKMLGLEHPAPLGGDILGGYGHEEEFLAIVITNVYVSYKNPNAILRLDANGWQELKAPYNTSEGFMSLTENRDLLNRKRMPLFGDLALVPANFNPFKLLLANSTNKPKR